MRTGRWVFEMLAGDADLTFMHSAMHSGEILWMYLISGRGLAMFDGTQDAYMAANDYGGYRGLYLAHIKLDTVEVTGSVDGLLEAVVAGSIQPQVDAVLGTQIFSDYDGSFANMPYNPNVIP